MSTLNNKDKKEEEKEEEKEKEEENKEAELVKQLGGIFNEKGKLSSYEFEQSGIIDGITKYLSLEHSHLEHPPSLSSSSSPSSLPSHPLALRKIEKRWELFFNQFIKNNENCNSVKNFIQLLQSSLSLYENYQVCSNNQPNTHPFYHLRFLARPFYLDLSLRSSFLHSAFPSFLPSFLASFLSSSSLSSLSYLINIFSHSSLLFFYFSPFLSLSLPFSPPSISSFLPPSPPPSLMLPPSLLPPPLPFPCL